VRAVYAELAHRSAKRATTDAQAFVQAIVRFELRDDPAGTHVRFEDSLPAAQSETWCDR
jgi:hypothetical protein